MDIPAEFIVTVTDETGAFSADLSLPSSLPARELSVMLAKVLVHLDPRFAGWHSGRLIHADRELRDDETLADAGAFDGSELTVIKRRE